MQNIYIKAHFEILTELQDAAKSSYIVIVYNTGQ